MGESVSEDIRRELSDAKFSDLLTTFRRSRIRVAFVCDSDEPVIGQATFVRASAIVDHGDGRIARR